MMTTKKMMPRMSSATFCQLSRIHVTLSATAIETSIAPSVMKNAIDLRRLSVRMGRL